MSKQTIKIIEKLKILTRRMKTTKWPQRFRLPIRPSVKVDPFLTRTPFIFEVRPQEKGLPFNNNLSLGKIIPFLQDQKYTFCPLVYFFKIYIWKFSSRWYRIKTSLSLGLSGPLFNLLTTEGVHAGSSETTPSGLLTYYFTQLI